MTLILPMWGPGGLGSPTNGPDTDSESCAAAEDSVTATNTADRIIRDGEARPGTGVSDSLPETSLAERPNLDGKLIIGAFFCAKIQSNMASPLRGSVGAEHELDCLRVTPTSSRDGRVTSGMDVAHGTLVAEFELLGGGINPSVLTADESRLTNCHTLQILKDVVSDLFVDTRSKRTRLKAISRTDRAALIKFPKTAESPTSSFV